MFISISWICYDSTTYNSQNNNYPDKSGICRVCLYNAAPLQNLEYENKFYAVPVK